MKSKIERDEIAEALRAGVLDLLELWADRKRPVREIAEALTQKRTEISIMSRRLTEAETAYVVEQQREIGAQMEKLREQENELRTVALSDRKTMFGLIASQCGVELAGRICSFVSRESEAIPTLKGAQLDMQAEQVLGKRHALETDARYITVSLENPAPEKIDAATIESLSLASFVNSSATIVARVLNGGAS